METIVFSILVGFLAILGTASLVEWFLRAVEGRGCTCGRVVLLPLVGKDGALEAKLRCAYNSMRWDRWIEGGELVLLDMGTGEEELDICLAFAAGREDVHLISCEELTDFKGHDSVYKTIYSILY